MKWLLIILFFPTIAKSQIAIHTFGKIIVNGTSSSGVAIDTSPESLVYTPIVNINYNPLRPNQTITFSTDLSFLENNIPIGFSGTITFVISSGSPNVQLNGQVNNPVPASPGTYNRTVSNVAGVYTWN